MESLEAPVFLGSGGGTGCTGVGPAATFVENLASLKHVTCNCQFFCCCFLFCLFVLRSNERLFSAISLFHMRTMTEGSGLSLSRGMTGLWTVVDPAAQDAMWAMVRPAGMRKSLRISTSSLLPVSATFRATSLEPNLRVPQA